MSLPTVVTDFLTAVKNSLKQGSDLGSNVRGAAKNYLRAQDMATVLDLLQDAMDTSVALTATGGSATTVVDGAGTFVPGQQVGNVVVFAAGTTTADLRGVEARVVSNTDTTLTFANGALPATPVAGDTFQIRGGWFDPHIDDLREGKGLADSPAGSVYGEHRVVADALATGLRRYGTRAQQTLTLTGQPLNNETVVVAGKTYTFQTTLTNVDGNVQIGATAAESLSNLVAAVNLGDGSGTAYAAATTANTNASAAVNPLNSLQMIATALAAGTAGNSLTSTETLTNGSWGAATFSGGANGGTGSVPERTVSRGGLVTGSGSTTTEVVLNLAGGTVQIDQFRGFTVTVGSSVRKVQKSDENGVLTVAPALSAAPGSGVAVSLAVSEASAHSVSPKLRIHPGGQPGENAVLALLIETLESLMDGYVLPA